MKISELLNEIERLQTSDYEGGKSSLYLGIKPNQVKPLPGNSGFVYTVSAGRWGGQDVKLWDPNGAEFVDAAPRPKKEPGESQNRFDNRMYDWKRQQDRKRGVPGQLIAKLSVEPGSSFPMKGAVQVDTITVDEDYRGQGLAKSLYGIVLTLMKKPLLSGSAQTPGGRLNWLSLSKIPGVEMKGYVTLHDFELLDKQIDTIMGQLGGQYIGKSGREHYFAFDVVPGTGELAPAVKTSLSRVYGSYDTGLYAVWTGK